MGVKLIMECKGSMSKYKLNQKRKKQTQLLDKYNRFYNETAAFGFDNNTEIQNVI